MSVAAPAPSSSCSPLLLGIYFTPVARQAALRFGIVDRPDGLLKNHREAVPYLGGLAVFLAYLVALGLVLPFDNLLLGLLLAGTLTLLVGLIDDFGVLTPLAKLTGQGVAVFVLLRSGAVIELVEVPPALRWPLAAAWLLGVCNAFNLLDILDGLAAGVGALAATRAGRRGGRHRQPAGGRRRLRPGRGPGRLPGVQLPPRPHLPRRRGLA